MKKTLKSLIAKIAPSLIEEKSRLHRIEADISKVKELLSASDSRIDRLKKNIAKVEPYQPAYGISGIVDDPKRNSLDRCIVIESALHPLAGKRILDIGSSLGYVSFYMADRGAVLEGWEQNPKNSEVARLIQQINGVPVDFKTKELNIETISTIADDSFDIAIVLSVFHHITRFNGLNYTQKLVRDLMKKVPVLIVELAMKDEDPSLPWSESQPKNELEIFDLVKNEIRYEKIGEFKNHLSNKTRPLYLVSQKKIVEVNSRKYQYNSKQNVAYKNSPVAYHETQRRYYFHKDYIIKEYMRGKGKNKDNIGQILNEIQLLVNLEKKGIHKLPILVDYEVKKNKISVVIKRVKGTLLSNMNTEVISVSNKKKIIKDVLSTLEDLHELGINHNDVRAWNVIITDKHDAHLIDYGLAGAIQKENDPLSVLRLMLDIEKGASAYNSYTMELKELVKELSEVWPEVKTLKNRNPNNLTLKEIKSLLK